MAIDRLPSGLWRVRTYSRGRCISSRSFERKRDAERFEREQKAALAGGTWTTPKAGEESVQSFSQVYLASKRNLTRSSFAGIQSALNTHVLPEFGNRPLSSIAPSEVDGWAQKLVEVRSPATARKALGVFRQLYALAVRDGVVPRNPAAGIRLPAVKGNDPRPLTAQQLHRLAGVTSSERDRLMILVAGYGGLRFGELAGLQVRDVKKGRLHLVRSVTHVSGAHVVGDLKSHQSRTVSLPKSIMKDLDVYICGKNRDDWVFPSKAKTPLRRQAWSKNVLKPACSKASLDPISSHNLRDTAASLAIDAGASVVVVARMLGHQDASVTLRHYATLFPTDLDELAERMQTVIDEI